MARKNASTVTVATPVVATPAPAFKMPATMEEFMAMMAMFAPAAATPVAPVVKAAVETVKVKKPKVLTPYGLACEKAVSGAKTFAEAVKALHAAIPESAKYDKVLVGNHLALACKAQGEKNAKFKAPVGMPAVMSHADVKAYKLAKASKA